MNCNCCNRGTRWIFAGVAIIATSPLWLYVAIPLAYFILN